MAAARNLYLFLFQGNNERNTGARQVKYGMETDHKNTYKFSNVNEPTVKNMAIA
jgi:hypothetical protein